MGKYKRGNYIFKTYKGDHLPRHVHILKDDKEIARWDLQINQVMEGKVSRKIKRYIKKLVQEGKL